MRQRVTLAALALGLAAAGCGGSADDAFRPPAAEDPGPIHVHGLGINPNDGALFIATHTGLYRVAPGERRAMRVGDRYQDTMGFTVVGPDHFVGSGHPDLRDDLPPLLGLIESKDAGKSWQPVSLLGETDFHVLLAAGRRIYGFDATNGRLMASRDGGRTWKVRAPPEPLVGLTVDPEDPEGLVVSAPGRLYRSERGRWQAGDGPPGLLAWPAPGALFGLDGAGAVWRSGDGGRSWRAVGEVGGEPAAFLAVTERELYAALHDGTIVRSADGGRTWAVRSRP